MPFTRSVSGFVAAFVLGSVVFAGGAAREDDEGLSRVADILHLQTIALEAQREGVVIESIVALVAMDDDGARDAVALILNQRARSGEFVPAHRLIEAARGAAPPPRSDLWKVLGYIRDSGGHWRDRVIAAELLAFRGDLASIEILIEAYDEPRVLLPDEQVKEYVGEALAKVDHPLAGALLAERANACDPNHLLRWLWLMLEYENPQAVTVARRVRRRGEQNHELGLVEVLIAVFGQFGDKDDLPLLRPLLTDAFLSGFPGEDRESLEASLTELIRALEEQPSE